MKYYYNGEETTYEELIEDFKTNNYVGEFAWSGLLLDKITEDEMWFIYVESKNF